VGLNGDQFSKSTTVEEFQIALRNDIGVTASGQTLSEVLCLSHPEDLSSYYVESVKPCWGNVDREVVYSRAESEAVIVSSINPTHSLILF